jgi:ABC-type iron transport system FetAB ATPase subunit
MPPALLIKQLRSAFAGPFDLELAAGACAAITGPSGSGKSLFLRMVADLDPHEGEAWIEGRACTSMPAPEWRSQAIYLAAESGWWAEQVIAHFPAGRRGEVAAVADRLGLASTLLEAPVSQLSTGEKQRLAIIRALLRNPKILLLDEPTGALDQDSVARVESVLQERLAAGHAIVLVTHDPGQAQRLGHQRYRMSAGRLEAA